MNIPTSDKYLGIVNPLLIITNLQVGLDIPNLNAMCTTWLAEQCHKSKYFKCYLDYCYDLKSKDNRHYYYEKMPTH